MLYREAENKVNTQSGSHCSFFFNLEGPCFD